MKCVNNLFLHALLVKYTFTTASGQVTLSPVEWTIIQLFLSHPFALSSQTIHWIALQTFSLIWQGKANPCPGHSLDRPGQTWTNFLQIWLSVHPWTQNLLR